MAIIRFISHIDILRFRLIELRFKAPIISERRSGLSTLEGRWRVTSA